MPGCCENGLTRLVSDGQWRELNGETVSLDLDGGRISSAQPSQVLYVVPSHVVLSDIRPILGGIISNHIALSLSALMLLMTLLGRLDPYADPPHGREVTPGATEEEHAPSRHVALCRSDLPKRNRCRRRSPPATSPPPPPILQERSDDVSETPAALDLRGDRRHVDRPFAGHNGPRRDPRHGVLQTGRRAGLRSHGAAGQKAQEGRRHALRARRPEARPVYAGGSAAEHPAEIDLSALRYFAAQNDLERVAAEIRLLRSKNPDWDPPEDLFSEVRSGIDEQPLWDLFAKRDLVAVHAKMDEIKQDKPDWQPSSNFAGKLALAEAHDALVKASDAQQWGQVIDTASNTKMLLTCGDIDALWRTAEALVHTGDEPRAIGGLPLHPDDLQADRSASRDGREGKPPGEVAGGPGRPLQMGQRLPDGRNEFEQVRFDLLRRKIGEAAAGTSPIQPTPAEIDALSTSAASPAGQADAQLLGWYSYSRKDYAGAEKWFRTALRAGDNAKAAEGLVLALRDGGNKDEAATQAIRLCRPRPAQPQAHGGGPGGEADGSAGPSSFGG